MSYRYYKRCKHDTQLRLPSKPVEKMQSIVVFALQLSSQHHYVLFIFFQNHRIKCNKCFAMQKWTNYNKNMRLKRVVRYSIIVAFTVFFVCYITGLAPPSIIATPTMSQSSQKAAVLTRITASMFLLQLRFSVLSYASLICPRFIHLCVITKHFASV